MKTLGISLKANRAIYVAIEGSEDDFQVINKGFFELKNSKDQSAIKAFHESWMTLINGGDYNAIAIKERISKGRFAGGAITFKMEGLIQLSDYEIQIVHGTRLKSKLKDHDPSFGKIHSYQEEAARLAYYLLMINN